MSIVKMVSELEMVGFIKTNGTACRFVSLVCETMPRVKKGCPYVGVRKVARKIGIINANFNTSVRRKLAEHLGVTLSEVEYENGNVWYRHLTTVDGKPLPVVVNKTKEDGKHYIQFFPHKSTHKFVLPNGEEVAEQLMNPYLIHTSKRAEYKPCVVSIDLANVRELKASGVVIQMPDFEDAEKILT